MYIASIPNRNSPPAILLREGYREDGKVKTRTLANLSKLPGEAIAVLRLAVAAFPASPNTHDSLGEVLLASGDKDGASRSYRKALDLDPASTSAMTAIRRIQGSIP